MQNVVTVAKREFTSYINSPIAYIVAAVYFATGGFLFFSTLFLQRQADMRSFFELAPLLFSFITPILTMRLFAEERREGTLELLLTMPITDWQVVLGKFLASLGLVAVVLGFTLAFPFRFSFLGPIDKGVTVAGYIGMLLLCGGYIAVGLMASTFTKNQIIAAIIALVISFSLFLVGQLTPILPPSVAPLATAISISAHFTNIA